MYTLPETNSLAPENGWLEYKPLTYWVSAYFQGRWPLVSGRVVFQSSIAEKHYFLKSNFREC